MQKLHQIVDNYWAEIADAIPLIESLSDDEQFPQRELAAYVASKVRRETKDSCVCFFAVC